jgi:1-acyl-sn-glycerol-3-phosphate acyltransferase
MSRTVFDIPIISTLLRTLSLLGLKLFGWRIEGELPKIAKFVLIGAPHTSNWDGLLMLSVAFATKAKIFWMGKHSLFRWPTGILLKWLGGLPIDRTASHDVVSQSIELFRRSDRLILAIPPEGTRKKVIAWKTGFYSIANGAGVPIVMGFMDYRRKAAGFGPTLMPTGNIEADMQAFRDFYADITGKYPDQAGLAMVTPRQK